MNAVERQLYRELTHLLDRIATSLPEGSPGGAVASSPTFRARLETAESRLAEARASILEGYGRWGRALEDLENLWALAAWRSATAEEPAEQPTDLAA